MNTAPFERHSPTSFDAAKAIEPKAGTLRKKLLAKLREFPIYGLTDQQMQCMTNMDPSTQRPRRIELLNAKLIEDSGTTRATASGRQAVVWRAA
jgi:hypothetical protein